EAEIGEVPDGAREALGVGGGVLAIVLLDVEVAAVVVDDDVQVDPAGAAGLVLLGAAHGPVAGHGEARQALDVHVQQRARLAPLIALEALALAPRTARQLMARQHRPHRRSRMTNHPGQSTGAKVGSSARFADALLLGRRGAVRRAMRTRRAIKRPP